MLTTYHVKKRCWLKNDYVMMMVTDCFEEQKYTKLIVIKMAELVRLLLS